MSIINFFKSRARPARVGMEMERVRLERALQFATRRCSGVSDAVTKVVSTIFNPFPMWNTEYLIEGNGALVPIPTTTPQQFPADAEAVYLLPYANEPLIFRAFADNVTAVATGHRLVPSDGNTEYITRFPVKIALGKEDWVFAPADSMVVQRSGTGTSFPSQVLASSDSAKSREWTRVYSNNKNTYVLLQKGTKLLCYFTKAHFFKK